MKKLIIEMQPKDLEVTAQDYLDTISENLDWFEVAFNMINAGQKPVFTMENKMVTIKIFKQ